MEKSPIFDQEIYIAALVQAAQELEGRQALDQKVDEVLQGLSQDKQAEVTGEVFRRAEVWREARKISGIYNINPYGTLDSHFHPTLGP